MSRASLSRWFYALPRPAFAAVLMLAGFAMGATAWAVTTRYMARPLTMPLPFVQAGFEADAQPVADGVPTSFGRWSGDFTEVVGAQQGIAPKAGEKMLRFLRSDSAVEPSGAATFVGDMFQLVDLQPYREMLADGAAVVELTASFNALPAEEMTFQTCLWAFSGDPSSLPRNWQDSLHEELAYGSGNAHSDTDTHTWQRVTARMIVPAEATLLVMELKVAPSTRPVAPSGPLNFAGVYADEVQLQLRSDGPPATPATPH